MIRESNKKVGLVFNPATPLTVLPEVAHLLDLVLIMSVNPGFGGQAFIPESLAKLSQARRMIDEINPSIRLQIDGGVGVGNIADVARAGADTFVAGSAVFGSDDYKKTIDAMRQALAQVTQG